VHAAVYCRISKDDAGDRLGVDRQERLCRELAARDGLDIGEVLVDNDLSAFGRTRRPAFERLVSMLRAGEVATVLVYHVDRLYRRATDLERLVEIVEATGAEVRTVAAGTVDLGTASGRMVARMLGAAAQHESERLSERAKAKSQELAMKGAAPGGRPPFGYTRRLDVDGKPRGPYVVNESEAASLKRMAALVLEGRSLLSIARQMTAEGVQTREGRPWHHSTVRAVLINPAVAALRVHRREIAGPGEWDALLDRTTWEQVRAVLADPARKRTRPARSYLLAGLVESVAGDPMVGRSDRGAKGTTDRRTYATRSPATAFTVVDAVELETVVIEMVLQLLDVETLDSPAEGDDEGAHLSSIEGELAELAELRGRGEISLAEWMAARKPLQERIEVAKAGLNVKRRPAEIERLLAEPGAARKAWDGDVLSFAGRRRLLQAVVARVVVGPASRGRWTTIEERLDPDAGWGVRFRG
jgi:site-specific DNA recombinase